MTVTMTVTSQLMARFSGGSGQTGGDEVTVARALRLLKFGRAGRTQSESSDSVAAGTRTS